MRVIGVTGGVGAGKSTVLDYLKTHFRAYIVQADVVGHEVMEPGKSCYQPVLELFGENVLREDKTIDRKRVSDVVFNNEEMLRKLNAVIHPAVKQEILRRLEEQKRLGCGLFIVEAALLLEDHYEQYCDEIWYIHADRDVRIARLMDSRGYSRQKAEDIMGNQASDEFYRSHADYVVDNSKDLTETCRQIEEGIRKHEIM